MEVKSISDFQRFIHDSIIQIGGYWPPLSAIARLFEEVGELCYEIKNMNDGRYDGIEHELTDIFIISTCIANQYSAHLEIEYTQNSIRLPTSFEGIKLPADELRKLTTDMILNLNNMAGSVARIVNSYEGSKRPKEREVLRTVSSNIASLHKVLFDIASLYSFNLLISSRNILNKKLKRDRNRFEISHDPTMSSALQKFETLRSNTHCLYATHAKVWGASSFNNSRSFDENMFVILPEVLRFTRIAVNENLDGFIIELPSKGYGDTIGNLSKCVNKFLRYLNANDPYKSDCLEKTIELKKWQFEFNDTHLFVITFAPCYPTNNPRYSSSDSTFIFIQPQKMFKKKIGRDKIGDVKDKIRKDFKTNGQEYEGYIMDVDFEAYKFVKPLNHGEPPIKWWEN